jgi:hypothetical protein
MVAAADKAAAAAAKPAMPHLTLPRATCASGEWQWCRNGVSRTAHISVAPAVQKKKD